ncbi:4912_t:CDS:2, partial [Ambispora leptoticha]
MSHAIVIVMAEVKQQRRDTENELSQKVLDEAFTGVAKCLFPSHVYPTQAVVKETFKAYMEEIFPDFMSNISSNNFTNHYHSNWLSQLLQKIKNNRGAVLQSVRSAVWRVFGREKLPPLKSNAAAAAIVSWKESQAVSNCYRMLFEKDNKGTLWVYTIARTAFSAVAVPTLTSAHCAFMLVVCDILLNPRLQNVQCTERRMKRCIEKYLQEFEGDGPSHDTADA